MPIIIICVHFINYYSENIIMYSFDSNINNIILFVTVFCIVLFVYSHTCFELKQCHDHEIIHIEEPSKDDLEKIFQLKQPISFHTQIHNNYSLTNLVDQYPDYTIEYSNMDDVSFNINNNIVENTLLKNIIYKLHDTSKHIKILNNCDFINRTILNTNDFKNILNYLKPFLTVKNKVKMFSGSNGLSTDVIMNEFSRSCVYITEGTIDIELYPPNYTGVSSNLNMRLSENRICIIPNGWKYKIKYNDLCFGFIIDFYSVFYYILYMKKYLNYYYKHLMNT
jgi:hypothetical protein